MRDAVVLLDYIPRQLTKEWAKMAMPFDIVFARCFLYGIPTICADYANQKVGEQTKFSWV